MSIIQYYVFYIDFITLKLMNFNKIQATYGANPLQYTKHVTPTVRKKIQLELHDTKKSVDIYFNIHKYSVEFYTVQFGNLDWRHIFLCKSGSCLMSLAVMSSHTAQMDMAMKFMLTCQSNLTDSPLFYHTTASFYMGSKLNNRSRAQEILLTFCQ